MRSAAVAFVIAFVVILLVGARARTRSYFSRNVSDAGADASSTTSAPLKESFHAVTANGPINVDIEVGASPSLKFQASRETLPKLRSAVKDGVLIIWLEEEDRMIEPGPITATIKVPSLDQVTLDGSGNITARSIDSPTFSAALNGSGDIKATGRAQNAKLSLAGSGEIDASHLASDTVGVEISGSGNIGVNARTSLDASVEGSGDVRYVGHPATVHQSISGSGRISAAD